MFQTLTSALFTAQPLLEAPFYSRTVHFVNKGKICVARNIGDRVLTNGACLD